MTRQPRWTLVDPDTSESWEFPRNPKAMTSPHPPKNTTIFARAAATPGVAGVCRVLQFRQSPYEWQFTGDIRTEEHYDTLIEWCKKSNRLELTDHLGRTWQIRIDSMDLNEQRPTARNDWRFEYTVKANIYGEIQ